MIASARMYEWTPSLARAWATLLGLVARRAAVPLEILGSRSAISLDELWAREDLGCGFMCGYPWALRAERLPLLAAPVPSPPRLGGEATYVSDFVVKADGPLGSLEDTFGGRLAYSTEGSHSGYNAPRYHVLHYRTAARPTLYRAVLGPYGRQRPVLDAVLHDEADVAAVDGYAFDLLRRHDPTLAERFRIVATTEPAPSPPLEAPVEVRARLRDALLTIHDVPEAREVMDALLLGRFEAVEPERFEVFLERRDAAARAGYPKLA